MDPSHRLAIADPLVGSWVVVVGVDVDKGKPRCCAVAAPVALLQKAHFPQAERAAAIEEQREFGLAHFLRQ
jgi:hypothetical protein